MKKNQTISTRGGKRAGAGRKLGGVNKTTAEVAEIAQQYGPEAVQKLWQLGNNAKSEQARVAALKEILDRAYGKSKQTVEGNVKGNLTIELQRF